MNITVEEYTKLCSNYSLSPMQVIWILNLYEDKKPYPESRFYMSTKEWNNLRERNIVNKNGEVSTAFVENALGAIRKKKKKQLGEFAPIMNDKVKYIIEYLNENLFEFHKPKIKVTERTLKKFDGNKVLNSLFFTWLWLFPTKGDENESWEKLFGAKYDNVVLRRSHDLAINNFIKMAKKYDIAIYIIATYLFIKDHIKPDGKCYIPKIENFIKVQEEWYDDTVEIVEEADKEEDLYYLFEHKTSEEAKYTTHGVSVM